MPDVIGEGTYGCVTKPSVKCKNKKVEYNNKLSKIMRNKDAIKEYNEMKEISRTPNIEKYIVSLPEICDPITDDVFHKTIENCDNEKFPYMKDEDFSILVIEDGGVSLRIFLDEIVPTYQKKDIQSFISQTYTLLEGLLFFYENDIIHHDIKTRNVVYNVVTAKIQYIDFGLMKKRSQMKRECKNDENTMAQTWDNFPPEYEFANYSDYRTTEITMEYNYFLERLCYTFDWYSMGVMMKTIIRELFEKKKISKSAFKDLSLFFEYMGNDDITKRNYDIYEMSNQYKLLLQKHQLWTTVKPKPSAKSIHLQDKFEKSYTLSANEKTVLLNALKKRRILKKCKNGYKRNKKTNRCIKNCVRNPKTGRCVTKRKTRKK